MKSDFKGVITSTEKKFIDNLYKDSIVQKFLQDLNVFSLKYVAAMHETETKLKILNEDFKIRYNRTPIEQIETRIKTPESLIKKMLRNELPFTLHALENNIFDVAGIRVVCSFISDIFTIVDMIRDNPEFKVLKEKDYINNPKPSGYRSYHMIVKVPIYLTTGQEDVIVEIQIRTMAMDFWASLEHKIKYKYDGIIPEDVQEELVNCSNSITECDNKMMNLNNIVQNIKNEEV